MKKSNTIYLTQPQLNKALREFKKDIILIMKDFAEYAVYKSDFKRFEEIIPATKEGRRLMKEWDKYTSSKKYKSLRATMQRLETFSLFSSVKKIQSADEQITMK